MLTTSDREFKKFGFKLHIKTDQAIAFLKKIKLPREGNIYVASDKKFESLPLIKKIGKDFYGEAIEAGYCCGRNRLLNCVEFHACPEVNIAADDCILFLGTLENIVDGKIKSKSLTQLYLKKGEAILLYPSTLHFSPCVVKNNGFHVAVILSKGTNTPLKKKRKDKSYWMNNKWLIAHKDSNQAKKGAYVGIEGENLNARIPL